MEKFTDINALSSALSSNSKRFISGIMTVYDNEKIKVIYKLDNQTLFKKYIVITIDGNEYYIPRFNKMTKMIDSKYKNYF